MVKTCNKCGFAYNDDNAIFCTVCNNNLNMEANPYNSGTTVDRTQINDSNTYAPASESTSYTETYPNERIASERLNTPPNNPQTTPPPHGTNTIVNEGNTLEGRISHIERNDEIPPPNIYATLSKIILFFLFFIPYIAMFITTALLSISFAIVGFQSISHMFNPISWSTALFEFLEVLVLGRMRGNNTIPIYRGMIEDTQSLEYAFLFRGPIGSGNLIVGHHVRLTGNFDRGTFITQNGMDLTSHSEILSTHRNPWNVIFCFLMLILLGIGITMYLNLPYMEGYIG